MSVEGTLRSEDLPEIVKAVRIGWVGSPRGHPRAGPHAPWNERSFGSRRLRPKRGGASSPLPLRGVRRGRPLASTGSPRSGGVAPDPLLFGPAAAEGREEVLLG